MRTVVAVIRLLAAFVAFQAVRSHEMPFVAGIVIFVIPAALLGGLATRLEHSRRRWLTAYRDRQAQELLQRLVAGTSEDEPLFLYLRPFSSTGKLTIQNPQVFAANAATPQAYASPILEAESVLRDALDRFGTLVGLGRQGEHYGAGRVTTDDDHWRTMVELLTDKATLVFLLPSDHPGTLWEIQHLREGGYLDKTVLVMPPAGTANGFSTVDEWERARTALADDGIILPAHQAAGSLFPAVSSKQNVVLAKWVTLKERKLRRGLQHLATQIGVPLAPRAMTGRRTDAPVWPPFAWMILFSLMSWGTGLSLRSFVDIPWLSAIAVGLMLFLFLEATYGRLSRKALVLVVIIAMYSTSPYSFFPSLSLFYYAAPWLYPEVAIKAAILGLLFGILLRELTPQRFQIWRVIVLTVTSVSSVLILEYLLGRYISIRFPGIGLPYEYLMGLFFGLALPTVTKWDPWKKPAEARASLGIEGTFIGWAILGFALSQFGSSRTDALWLALAFGGALAQCFGWYRQGRPIGFARGFLLVTFWTLAAIAALMLTSRLGIGVDSLDFGSGYFERQLSAVSAREGAIGLLFGVAAGALSVLVRRNRDRSWARAGLQALFLGVGFGLIGKIGMYFAPPLDFYGGDSSVTVPLAIILPTLMATASYFDDERVRPHGLAELPAVLPREIAFEE
jgi:hypothetical protein